MHCSFKCSVSISEVNINKLKNIPIRAYVGSLDKIVSPTSTIQMIAALKKVGGKADVVILDGATHFGVSELAFKNDDLLISFLIFNYKK